MKINDMVSSLIIFHPRDLKQEFRDYFSTSLADFYVSPAHRWLVTAIIFFLSGLAAFAGLWIYDLSYGIDFYNDIPLAFKGMYAWHTAINFAVCWLIMDMLINFAPRAWGAYNQRTVGKTWILFLLIFPLGFTLQRTWIYQMVDLYYPKWILRHEMYPSERPEGFAMFLFMLAFWLVIGYIAMRIILSMQERSEELMRVRIDTILEERLHPPKACPKTSQKSQDADDPISSSSVSSSLVSSSLVSSSLVSSSLVSSSLVSLPLDANVGPIGHAQIGHVTAEDHYLRIHYSDSGFCQETLIRMSLKEIASRLPTDSFIQIHRSHIVNLNWIAGVKRAGREVRLTMKHGDFTLPVSRYRLPQLLPVLDQFLGRGQRRINPIVA